MLDVVDSEVRWGYVIEWWFGKMKMDFIDDFIIVGFMGKNVGKMFNWSGF